jgi:hypothetical protein
MMSDPIDAFSKPPITIAFEKPPTTNTRLARTQIPETPDLVLWKVIEDSTRRLSFDNYTRFMDYVLCGTDFPGDNETPAGAAEIGVVEAPYTKPAKGQPKSPPGNLLQNKRHLPFTDTDAYRLLKVATEAFLMVNCGVKPPSPPGRSGLTGLDEKVDQGFLDRVGADDTLTDVEVDDWWGKYQVNGNRVLPLLALIQKKLPDVAVVPGPSIDPNAPEYIECLNIVQDKLVNPCLLELIWSYWHEEGMLVQTMNAISRRFQNIRGPAEIDPLAMLEIGNLRPLNNLLWGYIQDEQHRLSLARRAYEYDHHYGLALVGKAVPVLRPADTRSKFLEAFHNLLHLCSVFFQQDDDTTVKADGFPVLNAVKDLQLVLTEGQHNQFGDLPSTARIEMLMQQWLLARPEFRELLPTRESVAYPEGWMDRVDGMKKLQGWTDTSVRHFNNLAVYGEQILLSVRYGAWTNINDGNHAVAWARVFRPAIQSYVYAYQAVTGVDLTADVVSPQDMSLRNRQPSVLLSQRSPNGSSGLALPAASPASRITRVPQRSKVQR